MKIIGWTIIISMVATIHIILYVIGGKATLIAFIAYPIAFLLLLSLWLIIN